MRGGSLRMTAYLLAILAGFFFVIASSSDAAPAATTFNKSRFMQQQHGHRHHRLHKQEEGHAEFSFVMTSDNAITDRRLRPIPDSNWVYYNQAASSLTFYGTDKDTTAIKVVTFPPGDVVIDTILIDSTPLQSGDTMILISHKDSGTGHVILRQSTPGNGGNLACPNSPTLAPGEGIMLEYSNGFWYSTKRRRTVQPTSLPSQAPSSQPTNLPSQKPTHLPTTFPTQMPTKAPTMPQVEQLASLPLATYVGTAVSENASIYLVNSFSGKQLLRSVNQGASFSAVSGVPSYEWRGVAMDYQASIIYVAANTQMFKNSPGGAWIDLVNGNTTLALDWRSLSTNPTGTVVMGAAYSQGIWRSANSGSTWVNVLNATMSAKKWTGVAMSSDGSKIVGSAEGPGVFRSTDFGATWREVTAGTSLASTFFSAIACSADGRTIFTCTYGGLAYASYDSGASWFTILNVSRGYAGIGCNPTGTVVLLAVYGGGFVYRLTY